MPYFERLSARSFRATASTGGAWNTAEQHIAPALGLLVHCVEVDRDMRRHDDLVIGRLSFDILGTVPIGEVETIVEVLRLGRTIELVQATLRHDGRTIVLLRAWLMRSANSRHLGHPCLPWPHHKKCPPGIPRRSGPAVTSRRSKYGATRSPPVARTTGVRTAQPLVEEAASPLASLATLFDIANGMTMRMNPKQIAFPNVDLTVHLFSATT
ncbi:hypothetical protein FHT40_006745 [Mycolicibacterium sp. BK556]|uniref:acyl-CoA thioesterase domain-containing protein n=1 Tax=unclassified Mycolicibacterium TaxID=2636767 RepID=UPI001047C611|nr:hypothetical protein [Mycolicibacterium sp. BK556]MBB3636845.1 hypothetical protein [Mycolicibacterium sp. BK607]